MSNRKRLIDGFGRQINYLRVSVTDRCDLRCSYCLPKGFKSFEEPAHWLSHEEMARLVGVFVSLGIGKIRLTGGEPLTRKGIADFAAMVSSLDGVEDLSLSTNATRLSGQARALYSAGIRRLNVSLDTLDKACFASITGRDCLEDVLAGLDVAKSVGFKPIKLNCVVQSGVNLDTLHTLFDYSLSNGFVLRLIETMPVGDTGRAAGYVDVTQLGASLARKYGLLPHLEDAGAGPARYWSRGDGLVSFGVITPRSQHFCERCNRVRLGADGTLYLCLGHEDSVPLGTMLRDGASDSAIESKILSAISEKPERHYFNTQPDKVVRFMAQTGG